MIELSATGAPGNLLSSGNELYIELKLQIVRYLCTNRVDKEMAIDIGIQVNDYLVSNYGGLSFYLPVMVRSKTARKESIFQHAKERAANEKVSGGFNLAADQTLTILEEGERHKSGKTKRMTPGEEFLIEIKDQIKKGLSKGISAPRSAEAIAEKTKDHLAWHLGGAILYVPKLLQSRIATRNAALYADFESGITHLKLAVKYHLTVRQVYEVLQKERRLRRQQAKTMQH